MGRARKVKRLRRVAERLTPGKPLRGLAADRKKPFSTRRIQEGVNRDGTPRTVAVQITGALTNDIGTTRGMYRMMKKGTAREAARKAKHANA